MPPRPDLPRYVNGFRSRGKFYTYYRRDGQKLRPWPAFGTPEWHRAYAELHEKFETAAKAGPDAPLPGSLRALVVAYKGSPEWRQVSDGNRKDYRRYLDSLCDLAGDKKVATMPAAWVIGVRDKFADTPRTANYYVQVISLLIKWSIPRGWRPDNSNPATGVRRLKTGTGAATWDDTEYQWAIAAVGPKARLALILTTRTAQRGGDVCRMTWSDYDGSAIHVVQAKTGNRVWIPAHPDLQAALSDVKKTAVTIVTGPSGRPMKIDRFRHWIKEELRQAGLEHLSLHGIRKIAGPGAD